MTGTYKVQFIIVIFCILISSIASISVSLSLRFLLDDFIIPLNGAEGSGLFRTVHGADRAGNDLPLRRYRDICIQPYDGNDRPGCAEACQDEMFEHMQKLPIRYFDQNTNGSIMSLYTNDTDTLRQMINQSIPLGADGVSDDHRYLYRHAGVKPRCFTILAVVMILVMILVAKTVAGNSGKYFIRQQLDLASVTGFVEERMNGQRVVKVFNHEQMSEEEFDKLNDELFTSAIQSTYICKCDGVPS